MKLTLAAALAALAPAIMVIMMMITATVAAVMMTATIIVTTVAVPASAQGDENVPIKNALVVLAEMDDPVLQSILAPGGSPSNINKALELAEELLSVSAYRASTDSKGQFEFNVPLKPGTTYNMTVFAPGFVALPSDTASVTVAEGGGTATHTTSAARNMTILLQQSAVVSGRVTDEKGKPIPGIVVAAASQHSANYDITMDDGVFVLDTALKSGSHSIYAFKPGTDIAKLRELLVSNNADLANMLPPTGNKIPPHFKVDDAGYVSHVSKVQLEQGKLTNLDIQLKSSHKISGRVTDSEGKPVAGVAVFAFDRRGNMANTIAITDSDGRYTLDNDLARGTYHVVVVTSLFGGGKGLAPASATVNVPAESSAVDFTLHKSSSILGRVVDANGKPVANATIFAIPKELDLISSSSAGGGGTTTTTRLHQFLAAGMATARTDKDGRFTLADGIRNGTTYVVTALFGNLPISSSVEIRPEGSSALIVLDFSEIVVIRGKITDSESGKPVANAAVIPGFASIIPGAELFVARSNPDGVFELTIPLKDISTRSLLNDVVVSADGYQTQMVEAADTISVEMKKASPTKITGVVIAQQKSLSPPIETALTRKGTLVFDHQGSQYSVGLKTNSRVLDSIFDHASKRINIHFEGAQGSAGKSEFTIPKEFLAGPFAVSLDERIVRPESVKVTENSTHTIVEVEHEHGLQEIMIQGTKAVPEFPLPAAALAAFGFATLLLLHTKYRKYFACELPTS